VFRFNLKVFPRARKEVTIAAEIAERHEAAPSTLRKSRFRRKIDLDGGAVDEDLLEAFKCDFYASEESDLRPFLGEESYDDAMEPGLGLGYGKVFRHASASPFAPELTRVWRKSRSVPWVTGRKVKLAFET